LDLDPLPDDVRQFLESSIDSLEQLETLRVLGEDPAKEWPVDELSRQIQSTTDQTPKDLSILEGRGMLRCVRREGRVLCSFGPKSSDLESQIHRLLELYLQRPVTMIRMLYERKANVLRDFSDAFRFRKGE
jgi:hypothetical protein